jgi:hypothetical protein
VIAVAVVVVVVIFSIYIVNIGLSMHCNPFSLHTGGVAGVASHQAAATLRPFELGKDVVEIEL